MLDHRDKIRILIAAGGTGGHLLPALEVARKLESSERIKAGRLRIEFVGVGRPVEKTILQDEGFVSHVIPGMGLRGGGLSSIKDFVKIFPGSYQAAREIIDSFKPDLVAGFGGYPSVVPILAARLSGLPTWIHEADSSAGWATKFLALFATEVSSGFEDLALPFCRKSKFTGHPIRSSIRTASVPNQEFVPRKILILGGSQASRSLDMAIPKAVAALGRKDIVVQHQARLENCAQVLTSYQQSGINAEVSSFISEMVEALDSADIIVSRSGAGAVMELSVLNKPIVFVPLTHVSSPQLHNARTLEKHSKALIVEEGDNFELRLEDAISHLLTPDVYREMVARPFIKRKAAAAEEIANGILGLIEGK